jgi:hypothetical protein
LNKKELQERLNLEKISTDVYSLNGGLPNERFCLGQIAGKWEIYYSERGDKTGLVTFDKETEACEYFYRELHKMLKSTGI